MRSSYKGKIIETSLTFLPQGIGIATTVIVFLMNAYYIVILAWDVYYMVLAFNTTLPWSHCDNYWNTDR